MPARPASGAGLGASLLPSPSMLLTTTLLVLPALALSAYCMNSC